MLTFKKLKFYDALSEETTAFSADVYWKGVFLGSAENTGKGGMTNLNNWDPAKRGPAYVDALKEATEFAKTQSYNDATLGNFDCLEDYIDVAAVEADNLARVKKAATKLFKTQVVAVTNEKPPRLITFKPAKGRTVLETADLVKKQREDVVEVLNLIAIEDAARRWLEVEAERAKAKEQ